MTLPSRSGLAYQVEEEKCNAVFQRVVKPFQDLVLLQQYCSTTAVKFKTPWRREEQVVGPDQLGPDSGSPDVAAVTPVPITANIC